jgi:hypothetical protein
MASCRGIAHLCLGFCMFLVKASVESVETEKGVIEGGDTCI